MTREELLQLREEMQTEVANLGTKKLEAEADMMHAVNALERVHDDLDTLDASDGKVKLYEVDRETWISLSKDVQSLIFFDHIDGMYSYCVNQGGDLVHLSASTPVYVHPDLKLDSPERRE